ncbi:site-specific integrase [Streptomyces fuscichromogenes]|uniref:site-specific integrase n=1 Tax=Streptomyces fuscichromogenes TaxID=1324013 RepID=UPI00382BD908
MPVQRVELDQGRTWTVIGSDHLPVAPIEEFLEFLRVGRDASPHTVRSYAASLSVWWDYLEATGLAWDAVTLPSFLPFMTLLRTGDPVGVSRLPTVDVSQDGVSEATVGLRVAAVLSFYRYHADVHGLAVAGRLYRAGGRRARSRYVRALAHLDRGGGHTSPAVRVRTRERGPAPVFTPAQAEAILDGCARFDSVSGQWSGSVRDRLLFVTLNEWLGRRPVAPYRRRQLAPFCGWLVKIRRLEVAPEGGVIWDRRLPLLAAMRGPGAVRLGRAARPIRLC